MSGKGLPMMPWFPRDFLAATRAMRLAERGAYRDLLDYQWELGRLPNGSMRLAMLIGCSEAEFCCIWPSIADKFASDDTHIWNERLEEHRVKAIKARDKHKAGADATNAKRAAERYAKRTLSDAPSDAPSGTPPTPTPTPTPTPSPTPKKTGGDVAKAPSTSRGTRLPKDFVMTPERSAYAVKHGLDPSRVYGMFTTYWWGKAGAGATKLDWEATWQHWCMKDAEKNTPRPNFMNQPAQRAKTIAELEAEGHTDELTRSR